jgi:hypothetical protein
LEAERVEALGSLCSLRSKWNLAAKNHQGMHFSSFTEKTKWIEDYVDRETAGARK